MKRNLLFLLFVSFAVAFSCDDEEKEQNRCVDVLCTEEFRTIAVKLKDHLGDPIALDSMKVFREQDGRDITMNPLVDDFMLKELQDKKVTIWFKGFVGGKVVASAKFVVSADCCHVILVEGDTNLTIK